MTRIRDYLLTVAGLAIFVTACSTRQGFWVILSLVALAFPVYAAWALHWLRTREEWPIWMLLILSAGFVSWCWVVVGFNAAQPSEEEITGGRGWLGLVTFLVISDLTRSGRPHPTVSRE